MELFGEVIELLGGVALLENVHQWGGPSGFIALPHFWFVSELPM